MERMGECCGGDYGVVLPVPRARVMKETMFGFLHCLVAFIQGWGLH